MDKDIVKLDKLVCGHNIDEIRDILLRYNIDKNYDNDGEVPDCFGLPEDIQKIISSYSAKSAQQEFIKKCSEKYDFFNITHEEHKNGNKFFKQMTWIKSYASSLGYNRFH